MTAPAASVPAGHPPAWALALGFAVIYVTWGTTYLPMRIGVRDEGVPPALFGGVRVFCGGLVLFLYQLCRGSSLALSGGDFFKIAGVSWLLFVAGSGLMNVANQTVDSAVCAVLAATTPLWLGLFAMAWPRGDRLGVRGWLGLLLGLGGVLILLLPRIADSQDFFKNIGALYCLGSAASWALGALILRHTKVSADHLTTAAYQMMFGGLSLTLVGIGLGEIGRMPEQISARAAWAFLYLLIFGSLVGFVAFNWLLAHVTAAKVGTYAYVNPLVAVLVGWLAGEEITAWLGGGIAVILLGVFLVRSGDQPAQLAAVTEPGSDAPVEPDS